MRLVIDRPSRVRILDVTDQEVVDLQNILRYRDRSVEEKIRKARLNPYLIKRMGEEDFNRYIDDLNSQLYKSLLYSDDDGFYTFSGLSRRVNGIFHAEIESLISYPEFRPIPWKKPPEFDARDYQEGAVEKLLSSPHSHVEIATGLGKSHIVVLLIKSTGLPTIVSTPSIGLARSMYKELCDRFGKNRVGLFGAGKREIGKDFLVAVGKSLSLVEEKDFHKFSKYQVFISDESHTLPSNQFSYFCDKVLGHCPYRWFMSATQERNDGKDLVLEGLIGERVYEISIQEGMEKGYLAKLNTLVFDVSSHSMYQSKGNSVKMNQFHFYGNTEILNILSTLIPQALSEGIPTLILIDEHKQEIELKNRIGEVYEYARGGSDTDRICRDFNEGKILCVVGTSAVSVGTNFRPVRLTINWQGGKAETKFKQGVIGRSTRIDPQSGKTDCKIVDFRVTNIPMIKKHANARIKLYKEVGPVLFYGNG